MCTIGISHSIQANFTYTPIVDLDPNFWKENQFAKGINRINDNIKLMQDIWNNDHIYFSIYNLHNYLYNIIEHEYVPEHYKLNEEEINEVKEKYNIMEDSQWPEISRFDPVAQAIGLRPKNVCEIIRPSETAITAKYYRMCI